jgi:hypothetical protein
MMPHMRRLVSDAPGDRAEIYVAYPGNGLRDLRVAQVDPENTAGGAYGSHAVGGHA